ncbi:MAG: nitrate/nitrite transporter [Candidatus Methylomirabilia bacterium]
MILAVSTFAFLQVHIHRVAFAPLIPTFIADLGLTYAAAGAIMTAYFWTYAVAQIPIGVLTDRWGARRVMMVFVAVLALGVAVFPLSWSWGQSVLARALVGLGAAAVWVPSVRLISEWFPARERGRAMGIVSAGGGLGGTLGLLMIPVLADRLGWRLGYATMLIPVLLSLTLIVLFIRAARTEDIAGKEAVRITGDRPTGSASFRGNLGALRQVLATPELWPFNVAALLFYGAFFSLVTWVPTYLVKHGASPSQAGLVTSLISASTIVSWPLAGLLTDRLARRKVVVLGSQVLTCLFTLVFALLVPGLPIWAAAAVALGTGIAVGGLIIPFVMVAELFPPELAGTATGVLNTFFFIGALSIPVLLGRVVDLTGSFRWALVAAGCVQALATVAACFMRETGAGGRLLRP